MASSLGGAPLYMRVVESGDSGLVSRLMLHHIDHIEADLDLRVRAGPALREALKF
nr:hypothetical protein [Mesorhizobium sp. B2-3-11]